MARARGSRRKPAPSEAIREGPFPLRVGAVDTGSNAIRFMVAEFQAPRQSRPLLYRRVPVRLGHQVFLTGRLAEETMAAAVAEFVSFCKEAQDLGLSALRAVATSAVREARNREELVERIRAATCVELEVISGSEEARLVHLAVASKLDLAGGKWILVDLGGGSVEVSLVDDMGMLWSESHTMGSVRLLEILGQSSPEPAGFKALLANYVSALRIPAPAQYWAAAGFVATGGNIESLATLAGAPRDSKGVARVGVDDLAQVIDLLAGLSYDERVARLGLKEDRADVILPAAMVYHHLARAARAREIIVPGVGLKDGVLLDLVDGLLSGSNRSAVQEGQLTRAAISLGRRFMFDEAHGVQVARLALSLFDQTKDLHGLGDQDRLLLLVAALLHDIGGFISHDGHHKHSLYLISHSELPRLSPNEMLVVGNIARYHRKSLPKPSHPEFMRLPESDRKRVSILAALLRVADALDRSHVQKVKSVRVVWAEDELFLRVEGGDGLVLERWALGEKKDLFEKVFRKKLSLAVSA